MKRGICRIPLILVVLLWWCAYRENTLQADDFASLTISVSVVTEGSVPQTPDSFSVKLQPSDAQTPMPEGGEDILTFRGEGQNTFPEIHYTQPGIYRYRICQIPGKASCSYDTTQFHLTVTVTEGEKGLEPAAVLYREKESNKLELPIFYNQYPQKQPDTSEPVRNSGPVLTGVEDNVRFYAAEMVFSLMLAGAIRRWMNKRRNRQ